MKPTLDSIHAALAAGGPPAVLAVVHAAIDAAEADFTAKLHATAEAHVADVALAKAEVAKDTLNAIAAASPAARAELARLTQDLAGPAEPWKEKRIVELETQKAQAAERLAKLDQALAELRADGGRIEDLK